MWWFTHLALAADPFAIPHTVHTLDNGLTVLIAQDDNTDTVALHLHYDVGARDERTGEYGVAHLFEHLMFEGSANVPGTSFDEWLTSAGGWNNAFTSNDETAYHMSFPSGALDLALMIESDRMGFLDAALDQENLSNQQKVVLQERAEGFDRPGGRAWDALSLVSWPADHPYQHMVIGTIADVEGFTLDGTRDFWKRHYRPRNATLSLVGNLDPDVALARVRHWFSDIPDTGAAEARAEAPEWKLSDIAGDHVIEDRIEDRRLMLAWPTVPVGHPDAAALDVLAQTWFGGQGTRISDSLVYDKSIASTAAGFHSDGELQSQFIVYLVAEDLTLPKLKKKYDKAVAKARKTPVTDLELKRAKKSMRSSLLDSIESLEDRAERLVDCQRLTGDAICLDDQYARIEAVTSADVARVFDTYLDQRPVTLSVIPNGDDGAIAGASPVELP